MIILYNSLKFNDMKNILSFIITTMFGMNMVFAQKPNKSEHIGLYTMDIGTIETTIISDGHLLVNPLQAEFAQNVDSTEVAGVLEEHLVSTSQIDLGMNILFLKNKEKLILIDVGAGNVFNSENGRLVENLQYAGISANEITDIVLTHAHPDHIGGLTDRKGNLTFPNAKVYLAQEEYNFWMHSKPDFSKSTMTDKAHIQMLVDVAQANIKAVNDNLYLFRKEETLLGCLQMLPAPGHTPGHTVIRIFSEDKELYHIADVVHSEIISFEYPEWIYNSDTNYQESIETRKKILAQLVEDKALFFAYHLPWPGLGYVKTQSNGYKWIQKKIAMPY